MTAITVRRPTAPETAPSRHRIPAAPRLAAAVLEASDAVVHLDPSDPAWDAVGPLLTAFVDAARRAVELPASSIGPDEKVPPILRLRDLARLAARTASASWAHAPATPQVASCLRSLQGEARRCQSG